MIHYLLSKISLIVAHIKSRFIPLEDLGNPLANSGTDTVKEDTRTKKVRVRVAQAFEQQQEQMQARSLKPHDPSCKDPLSCTKTSCFERIPDKIVSKPYKVKRRMRKTTCGKKITS